MTMPRYTNRKNVSTAEKLNKGALNFEAAPFRRPNEFSESGYFCLLFQNHIAGFGSVLIPEQKNM